MHHCRYDTGLTGDLFTFWSAVWKSDGIWLGM